MTLRFVGPGEVVGADEVFGGDRRFDGLVSDGSWERGFFLGWLGCLFGCWRGGAGLELLAARYHGLFGFGWEWMDGWMDGWTARHECVFFLVLGLLFRSIS